MFSRHCVGRKQANVEVCKHCSVARKVVKHAIRRKECPGVKSPLHDVALGLEWKDKRQEFSSLIFSPSPSKRIRSDHCKRVKKAWKIVCTPCKDKEKFLADIKRRKEKHPPNRARRLLFSGEHLLTKEERQERRKKSNQQQKQLNASAARKSKAIKKRDAEIAKRRSSIPQIDRALQAMKQSLERDWKKLKTPTCAWDDEHGHCKIEHETLELLGKHVDQDHIRPRIKDQINVEPYLRRFNCHWHGCKRRFVDYKAFARHVFNVHVGTKDQLIALEASICSMINSNRKPQGRRYSAAVRHLCIRNYKSRSSYQRARKLSSLPLPCLRTVLRMKNAGGATSGIDRVILQEFQEKTIGKPEYRFGTLVFDEMHIRPGVKFNSESHQSFGYAHDQPPSQGKLAKQILVFQYVPLFTSTKFALNVAWYGTSGSTTAEKLRQWFWEVVEALDYYGFNVLATVCDGAGPNRALQNMLLEQQGRGEELWVENVVHPGRRIYVLSDPSHAIKKLRNSAINPKRCLKKILKKILANLEEIRKPFDVSWNHIKWIYEWQKAQIGQSRRVDRKLTRRHVVMKSFGKMKVQLAVDVFHHSISAILMKLANTDDAKWRLPDTDGTREFLRIGRSFWLTMNDRREYRTFEETQKIRNNLEEVSNYFDSWVDDINTWIKDGKERVDGESSEAFKKRMQLRFITNQCYEDISVICNGVQEFINYIFYQLDATDTPVVFRPKSITQDHLEGDFSILRFQAGGGANPTVYDAAFALRSINKSRLADL